MQIIAWMVFGVIALVMISGARSSGDYNRRRDKHEEKDNLDDGHNG